MVHSKIQIIGIFLFSVSVKTSIGIEKHWLPDLEWQTASNWIGGLLPDANSRVIFPSGTWHGVSLPNTRNVEVAEIYLSKDGSVYLQENANLKFTEANTTRKNVRWSKKGIDMWIDPDNWDGYSHATPHSERIPCDNDVVVLPAKNRTFSIALPEVALHVQAVRIADENMTLNRWEWSELVNTLREFYKSHLTITYASGMQSLPCNDCTCHGDMDEALAEEVCSYMRQMEKCGPAACEYPLKVDGHCCGYCGGRISLSGRTSLRIIEHRVNEALQNYRGVLTWHVRKTWNRNIEVLIAETRVYNGIDSQEAVHFLSNILKGDGYEVLEYMGTGLPRTDSTLNTILVPLFTVPVILVLLTLAVFRNFGYSYLQLISGWREACSIGISGKKIIISTAQSSFDFARFENVADGAVKLADSTWPTREENVKEDGDLDARTTSSSKRFENPLYRSEH